MSDRINELGSATTVVLITFSVPTRIDAYQASYELPFPIVIDPDRSTYHRYGLGRGSVARIYGRRAVRRYLEIFRQNGLRGWSRPTEDTLQLGGDFVIDPTGELVWGFWGEGPDDRPSVDDLVAAIRTIGS